MVVFPMSLVFVPAEISPDLEPVNINWSEKISLLIFKLRHATVLNIMVCSTVIMVKNSAVLTYMSISDSELAKGQKKNTKMHYGTPQRQLTELSELNFNKQTDHDWKKKKKINEKTEGKKRVRFETSKGQLFCLSRLANAFAQIFFLLIMLDICRRGKTHCNWSRNITQQYVFDVKTIMGLSFTCYI